MNKNRNIFMNGLKNFQKPDSFYDPKADQKQARRKIATGISRQVMDFAKQISEDLDGKENSL